MYKLEKHISSLYFLFISNNLDTFYYITVKYAFNLYKNLHYIICSKAMFPLSFINARDLRIC